MRSPSLQGGEYITPFTLAVAGAIALANAVDSLGRVKQVLEERGCC